MDYWKKRFVGNDLPANDIYMLGGYSISLNTSLVRPEPDAYDYWVVDTNPPPEAGDISDCDVADQLEWLEWMLFKLQKAQGSGVCFVAQEAFLEMVEQQRQNNYPYTEAIFAAWKASIPFDHISAIDCQNKIIATASLGRSWVYYVCSTYRKRKGICTSHQIRSAVVEKLLLESIREITGLAHEREDEFVRLVMKKSRAASDRSLRENRRELEQAHSRIDRLDGIIQRLYEDNLEGRISDERFARMSVSYETEQRALETRAAELRTLLTDAQDKQVNIDRFLALVRKYTDIQELTSEVLREFVEKVYVHQTQRLGGQKVQRLQIIYNCIGEFQV